MKTEQKTVGGFDITKFKKLETPIERGILEPHIYEGFIDLRNDALGKIQYCTWDESGRCSNHNRTDCFIDVESLNETLQPL